MIRNVTAALATGVCLLATATAAQAQDQSFNIPAGALKAALSAYGKQSGRPVLYRSDELRGARSPGVTGMMSADRALATLLRGSGYTTRIDASGAVAVVRTADPNGQIDAAESTKADAEESQGNEPGSPPTDVVVTGTKIHGVTPASPIKVVSREDLAETGAAELADALRTIPQNFGGGLNPSTFSGAPGINAQNYANASAVNLRGLGPDASLTLIDGQRVAFNGLAAGVDISVIPAIAVQRVEIVPDGSSTLYGSDAVAGVVNIILRSNINGGETTVQAGTATDGGATEVQLEQLIGKTWTGGGLTLAYEHYYREPLRADQREISSAAEAPSDLMPRQKKDSLYAKLDQDLSDSISVELTGLYSNRPTSSEITAEEVNYELASQTAQYTFTGKVDANVATNLHAELQAAYSQDKSDYAENYSYTGGAGGFTYAFRNRVASVGASLDGALFDLPSGPVSFAIGGGYRQEQLEATYSTSQNSSRSVEDVYGELRIPLVLPSPDRAGLEKLELSVSGRFENYSDVGSSFVPKMGLIYTPVADLRLRGTWGKSFRAPSLFEAASGRTLSVYPTSTYGIPNAPADSVGLILGGANRNLKPESAKSWTLGFDYTPSWSRGLKFSATYFSVNYRDRINQPITNTVGIYDNPIYAPFITKQPSSSMVEQILNNVDQIYSDSPVDPNNVYVIFNSLYQNAYRQQIHGVDLSSTLNKPLAGGRIALDFDVAWLKIEQLDTPTSTLRTITGTIYNPPSWRARAGATWTRSGVHASLFGNYVGNSVSNAGDYISGSTSFDQPIGSWTTFDLTAGYRFSAESRLINGLDLTIAVQNILNQAPPRIPFDDTFQDKGLGFDSTNTSAVGRFISLRLDKSW